MELLDATKMLAGYIMGMEPSGRELLSMTTTEGREIQ